MSEALNMVVNNMRLESVLWRTSMSKHYAFVTVEDLGHKGLGFKPPHFKKYWGEANYENQVGSLKQVMLYGGKWEEPTL